MALVETGTGRGDGFIAPDGIQDSSNSLPPLEPPITNQPPNQIKSTPPAASLLTHTHISQNIFLHLLATTIFDPLAGNMLSPMKEDAKIYLLLPPDASLIRCSQLM